MYLWEGWGKSNSGLGVGSGEYLLPTLLPRAFDGLIAQESGEGPGDLVVNRHPCPPRVSRLARGQTTNEYSKQK